MKSFIIARTGFALLILLPLSNCQKGFGQESWIPVGPPTITNSTIQTIGGITYFTYTSRLEGCKRVTNTPVARLGTNLTQTVNEEQWTGVCLCDTMICDPFAETHVSILGDLPPGNYAFQLFAEDIFQPFPPLWPFAKFAFTVPTTEPTLSVTATSNRCVLAVAGIPNVRYTIETSSTFINWIPAHARMGGPFTWGEPIQPNIPQRFYRVRIEGL